MDLLLRKTLQNKSARRTTDITPTPTTTRTSTEGPSSLLQGPTPRGHSSPAPQSAQDAAMSSEDDFVDMTTSHKTVILLFFFLLFLVLLLLFLYKRLNKQTNGEYTVSNMVLGEGGLQDRGRDLLQDSCLTPLWVRRWADRDDEEGRKGDDEDDEDESDGRTSVPNNKHPIYEKSKLIVVVEQARGGREEEEEEEEEEEVEEEEKEVEEEEKDGSSEEGAQGASLMINLKQFSGGAMWSEDDKDDGTIIDLTVL